MRLSAVVDCDSRPTTAALCRGSPNQKPPRFGLDRSNRRKSIRLENVQKHDDELIRKKQECSGRWRTAKVPDYATTGFSPYAIKEAREPALMLGGIPLSKITKANRLPSK
jgi:hypothetical protein